MVAHHSIPPFVFPPSSSSQYRYVYICMYVCNKVASRSTQPSFGLTVIAMDGTADTASFLALRRVDCPLGRRFIHSPLSDPLPRSFFFFVLSFFLSRGCPARSFGRGQFRNQSTSAVRGSSKGQSRLVVVMAAAAAAAAAAAPSGTAVIAIIAIISNRYHHRHPYILLGLMERCDSDWQQPADRLLLS